MSFAVVACSRCRNPWSVDLRHATSACPNCKTKIDLAHRIFLWQGDSARDAQAATAQARLQGKGAQATASMQALQTKQMPRHDSHTDAAAARAGGIINKSQRAEAVALWLSRLVGAPSHKDLLEALEKAGIETARAEAEVTRMLAMDVICEPKAGHYRALET